MLDERHSVSRQVVVALPEEIDIGNASQIEAELISAVREDATVIADMSATTFCDCAGARAVYRASERAAAVRGDLRVVITTAPVLRLFSILRIDQVISLHSGLDAALAMNAPRGGPATPGSRVAASHSKTLDIA